MPHGREEPSELRMCSLGPELRHMKLFPMSLSKRSAPLTERTEHNSPGVLEWEIAKAKSA